MKIKASALQKQKNGFVIMAALGLAVFVAVGSLAIIAYKNILDADIARTSVQHGITVAEDMLQIAIQMKMNSLQTASDLDTFINTTLPGQLICTGTNPCFSVPVAGDLCPSGSCVIRQVHYPTTDAEMTASHFNPACKDKDLCRWPPDANGDEYASIVIGYNGTSSSKSKVKVAMHEIKFLLPKVIAAPPNVSEQNTITACLRLANPWIDGTCNRLLRSKFCPQNPTNQTCEKLFPLKCTHQSPVFIGTERDNDGNKKAKCRDIASGNYSINKQALKTEVKCNVSSGDWMSDVNGDLGANCKAFPQGVADSNTVQLCDATNGSIAKSFELGPHFKVSKIRCIQRGDPYEFMAKKRSWNQ